MANKQITDLSSIGALDLTDELAVSDISDSNITKKATFSQVKTVTALTASEIKGLYESNADTNDFTDAEKTKLAGIATGATANSSDAYLLDRANHTGTQTMSTISDAGLLAVEDYVNLGYTASSSDGTVTCDQGTNATIPLVTASNAGLLAPIEYAIDQTESTTTSSTFQNKLTLTYTAVAGVYRIDWACAVCHDRITESMEVELWDGSSQLQLVQFVPKVEYSSANRSYISAGNIYITTLSAGSVSYSLRFRSRLGSYTAAIKQATITATLIAKS